MIFKLINSCNKASEVVKHDIAPEDEYEEPKWASIRDFDPRFDSVAAKSLPSSNPVDDIPGNVLEIEEYRLCLHADHFNSSNGVEFKYFYVESEASNYRWMWECEIIYANKCIFVTPHCNDINDLARLRPVIERWIGSSYPDYGFAFNKANKPRMKQVPGIDPPPVRAEMASQLGAVMRSVAQPRDIPPICPSRLPSNIGPEPHSQYRVVAFVPPGPYLNMMFSASRHLQYQPYPIASYNPRMILNPAPAWQLQHYAQPDRPVRPQAQLAPPVYRHLPPNRARREGRNGHEYIHAAGQHTIYVKVASTSGGFYVDLKNVMIVTRESIRTSLEALKSEMNAKGWTIESCECKGFPAHSPMIWRTFISFSTCEDAARALTHLGREGRLGRVKFVWVDYHKPKKTLYEGAPPFPPTLHQQAPMA